MKRFSIFVALMLIPLCVSAGESFPEPFGLTWNMSEAALSRLGFVRLKSDAGPIHIFQSNTVPKPWSKAESYLALTYNDRLIKVVAASTNFTDDIRGTEGKAAYAQLTNMLTAKYGKPSEHIETSGLELYKEYDEFYQCLKYAGCGAYVTIYNVAGGTIGAELDGAARGTGYLKITYESPAFAEAKSEVKNKVSASDSNAL